MKEAELRASFKPGEFKNTCTLAVTGTLEFAQGSLDKTDKKKEDGKEEGKDDKKGEEAKKVEKEERKEEAEKKEGGKEVEKKKKDKDEEEKPKNATLKIKGQLSRSKSSILHYIHYVLTSSQRTITSMPRSEI